MAHDIPFDLETFLPYLLNRAAERTGLGFQSIYRQSYGMLRTEWRVLLHLGQHGEMTAREICDSAGEHKTRVSRAVSALESKRFLTRTISEQDRRVETLALTRSGRTAYEGLAVSARDYDASLVASPSTGEQRVLRVCLARLGGL